MTPKEIEIAAKLLMEIYEADLGRKVQAIIDYKTFMEAVAIRARIVNP